MSSRFKQFAAGQKIPASEITPEPVYRARREIIAGLSAAAAMAVLPAACADPGDKDAGAVAVSMPGARTDGAAHHAAELDYKAATAAHRPHGFYTDEALTPYSDATRYNNFYEFGTDKTDPARYAKNLSTEPWSVVVDGEAEKTGTFNLEDILRPHTLEERIYRLRCVEAWSMVIPWIGFPLGAMLERFSPTSRARYVRFETLQRPSEMRGQRSKFGTIDWPYVEGLTMAEAMHPLTLIATGMYGKHLPNQNGAPLRLVVPWKYGFKSIKSIVRISFSEKMPRTTWNLLAPHEYGFYANVNPDVDHPRWSQASERRLPSSLFNPRRIATQMFNGYEAQVGALYKGLDLKKNF
ncbi:MAG: protein-methionine-sulfoxide reductase catalytic subunit MsrP [Pseudomonadales bacterium]|nr:protein-methionine-sulfoxide reductase catalytic subunit MsrP [Pseudomonadales bacterium]